jgi:DNA-binding PadR family transcriptional regulator
MYLALQRMEAEGLIEEAASPSTDDDARRRYYRITATGREVAERESVRLAAIVAAARNKNLLHGAPAGGREP